MSQGSCNLADLETKGKLMCCLGAQIDEHTYLTTDALLIKAIYHLCCFYYLTPLCLHLYSLTQKQNPHATRLVRGDNLLSSVTSSAPMSAGLSGTRAKNTVCCSNINPFDIHLLVWRQKIKLHYFTSLSVLNFHRTCWGLFKMFGVNTILHNISKYVVQVKWSAGFRLKPYRDLPEEVISIRLPVNSGAVRL